MSIKASDTISTRSHTFVYDESQRRGYVKRQQDGAVIFQTQPIDPSDQHGGLAVTLAAFIDKLVGPPAEVPVVEPVENEEE